MERPFRKLLDIVGWVVVILVIAGFIFALSSPGEKVPPDDVEITNLTPCLFINQEWTPVEKFTVLQYPAFCGVMTTQYPPIRLTIKIGRVGGGDGFEGHYELNSGDFVIEIPERLKSGDYKLAILKGRAKAYLDFSVFLAP